MIRVKDLDLNRPCEYDIKLQTGDDHHSQETNGMTMDTGIQTPIPSQASYSYFLASSVSIWYGADS